jgi:hypothetical protein
MLTLSLWVACETVISTDSDATVAVPDTQAETAHDTAPWTGGALQINEILARNDGVLDDGDGDSSDWIELYNPGPDTVGLGGWALTDDPNDATGWELPEGVLVGGGFLVVFASGKNTIDSAGYAHTDFKLSGDGETLRLLRPDGVEQDRITFPEQVIDVSYGPEQSSQASTLIGDGSDLRWTGTAPDATWTQTDFDDSSWSNGTLPVGFDLAGLDPDAELVNAALFQTTTQSSDGYGYTGAQGTDGELSTFTHTADSDLTPWWQVDLGQEFVVVDVDLYNRVGCCPERLYNIVVSLMDDSGATIWQSEVLNPVADDESPTDPGSLLQASPGGILARHVRVSKQAVGGARSSEWLSLGEVEVQVGEAAPYTDRIETDLTGLLDGPEVWLRIPVTGSLALDRLQLLVAFDDHYEAWIDDALVSTDLATTTLEPSVPPVLAVEVRSTDEDDLFLALQLIAETLTTGEIAWFSEPTPGAPNGSGHDGFAAAVSMEPPRGFFQEDISVTVTSETPGGILAYTLDGSAPGPDNGTQVSAPDDSTGPIAEIAVSTTAILRAVAWGEGLEPSPVATHTYLYLDDVVRQPVAPSGFPTTWDGMDQDPVTADYEMDPEVVDDPAYAHDLLVGLTAIPTLSLVMDVDDLFGADNGLYVHSLQRGSEWERPTSVELILPDGSTGFQTDAGVRLHGYGWRYHSNTRKHALRLEFRDEYGPKKLTYPLFPDAPVEAFDSIVLRCQGSRGWQDFRDPEQSQYLRDAFARDTARDMGKLDGHATFVHLYLNGLYWGLYNPVERPDAGFAEEYLGGDDQDYDAINRRTTTNEAINGDLVAYETLLALADEDLSDPSAYAAVQDMLNLEDLIDYMLVHQYTVNMDGPEIFSHNNMRGVRKREDGAQFHWFVWDMEYSLWAATDDYNIEVDVAGSISHVYARLRENADFRALYSARAREHLTGEGALTPQACLARWDARAEEIWDAVVGESARWGDAARSTPYTRDVEWMTERERLRTEFFPQRTAVLIDQLTQAGLYDPP